MPHPNKPTSTTFSDKKLQKKFGFDNRKKDDKVFRTPEDVQRAREKRTNKQRPAPKIQSTEELTRLASKRNEGLNKPEEKGFFTRNISTVAGIAGGVVGSLGGPAGTVAGAGLGAALGESVENVITGDPLSKNVLRTGLTDAVLSGLLLGAGKLVKFLFTRGAKVAASKGLSIPAVSEIASGKIISRFGNKAQTLASGGAARRASFEASGEYATYGTSRVVINTKNARLQMTYVQKMIAAIKEPRFVAQGLGALTLTFIGMVTYGSVFWGPNEQKDSMKDFSLAQSNYMKAGDYESVRDLDLAVQEAGEITAGMPVKGFIEAELAKLDALIALSASNVALANKLEAKETPKQIADEEFKQSTEDRLTETARKEERQDKRDAEFKARQK